jgi:hypothetical protein
LDEYLGDTDPNIPDDLTDEDIKEEYPILWVCQQISGMIDTCDIPAGTTPELDKINAVFAAVRVCRDINDSGESYHHDNADGAQALANLFSLVTDPEEEQEKGRK